MKNVGVHRTVALVLALAKLHNYCIDANDNSDLPFSATNEWQTEVNGGVPLVATGDQSSSHDVLGNNHYWMVATILTILGASQVGTKWQQQYNFISEDAGVPIEIESQINGFWTLGNLDRR
jgi:hypothetical protein